MKTSTAWVLAGVTIALAACNSPDKNRTTSVPPGVSNPTALTAPIVTPSAPPAPAERGPIPPNANAAAPGTNAALAFADAGSTSAAPLPPSKGGAQKAQALHVEAQEAAAKAPDTASADAAKEGVLGGETAPGKVATARDTPENNPRHGALTKAEETSAMPKAGQVNNHSSTALEKDGGR
ncbi:MAG TPA: hypothetical protein VF059_01535 [Casimicrobiaceae bacterium]